MKKAALVLLFALLPGALLRAQTATGGLLQARTLFDQKKYAEAAAILERADQLGQAGPTDLVILGMCDIELQAYDKARAVLDKAALLAPKNPALLAARANLAFAQKRFADAFDLFKSAHELDPGPATYAAGMVASLVNEGVELVGQAKSDEARKAFQEALVYDPRSVAALRNLGILELQAGETAPAAEAFTKALAVSPDDAQLLRLLFVTRNRQGDVAEELSVLDRLIAVQPSDPEVWAAKGRLLEAQGKASDALVAFRQAVDKGSQDPLPYYRAGAADRNRYLLHDAIGRAVQLAGALQLQAAQAAQKVQGKDDLQNLKLLTTQAGEVRATLGSAITLLREIDGDTLFEEDLKRLQSWYPGSVEMLTALGRFYAEKNRWPEALAVWQRVLQDHPLEPEAQAGAGHALESMGDPDQAILYYRRALDMQPESPDLYAALGRLYAKDVSGLRQILLDRSYRDTRNALLFRELAKAETALGLTSDADAHNARAAEIESASQSQKK